MKQNRILCNLTAPDPGSDQMHFYKAGWQMLSQVSLGRLVRDSQVWAGQCGRVVLRLYQTITIPIVDAYNGATWSETHGLSLAWCMSLKFVVWTFMYISWALHLYVQNVWSPQWTLVCIFYKFYAQTKHVWNPFRQSRSTKQICLQRFDLNRNGTIEVDELATVFQVLAPRLLVWVRRWVLEQQVVGSFGEQKGQSTVCSGRI